MSPKPVLQTSNAGQTTLIAGNEPVPGASSQAQPASRDVPSYQSPPPPLASLPFMNSVLSLFGKEDPRQMLADEIEKKREETKTVQGLALKEAASRLRQLENVQNFVNGLDRGMDTTTIQRIEFRKMIDVAAKKIILGTLDPKRKMDLDEGRQIVISLQKYEALEKKFLTYYQGIKGAYPPDSLHAFRLNFASIDAKSFDPYEPGLQAHTQSAFIQEYGRCESSKDPKERQMAAAIEKLCNFCKEKSGPYRADVRKFLGSAASLAELDAAVRELDEAVGSRDIPDFFKKVGDADLKKNEKNDGFKTRIELAESLKELKAYPALLAIFEKYEKEGLANLTPETMQKIYDQLRKRANSYLQHLVDSANKYANLKDFEKSQAFEKKTQFLDNELNGWKGQLVKTADGRTADWTMRIDAAHLKEAFDNLKTLTQVVYGYEEAHTRGLLTVMVNQVKAIPTLATATGQKGLLEGQTEQTLEDIGAINPYIMPTQEMRAKACLEIAARIETLAIKRTAQARILMYIQYQSTTYDADHGLFSPITNSMMAIGNAGSLETTVFLSGRGRAQYFDEIINRYQEVGRLMASGDPAQMEAGRKEFLKLEMGSIHRNLQGVYEGASRFLEFSNILIGVGIILAASWLGSLAGTLVRPFAAGAARSAVAFGETAGGIGRFAAGVGRVAAGALPFTTNVVAFTATSDFLHAVIEKPEVFRDIFEDLKKCAEDPAHIKVVLEKAGKSGLKFAGEVGLNALMFKYIGKAMQYYERGSAKVLQGLALRSASKALGTEVTAEMLAKEGADPVVKAAFEKEMTALNDSKWKKFFEWITSAGWEVAVLTPWQLPHNALQLSWDGLVDSIGDPQKSFKDVVSGAFDMAWRFSFTGGCVPKNLAYVMGLRAGSSLSMPLVRDLHESVHKFAMGKSFETEFRRLETEKTKIFEEAQAFAENREGNLADIAQRYENALLQQKGLLEQIPAEARNAEAEGKISDELAWVGRIKRSAGSLVEFFVEGNRFGVKTSEEGGDFVYSLSKKTDLISTLKSRKDLVQRVEAYPNGRIDVTFVSGERTFTKMFLPDIVVAANGPYR